MWTVNFSYQNFLPSLCLQCMFDHREENLVCELIELQQLEYLCGPGLQRWIFKIGQLNKEKVTENYKKMFALRKYFWRWAVLRCCYVPSFATSCRQMTGTGCSHGRHGDAGNSCQRTRRYCNRLKQWQHKHTSSTHRTCPVNICKRNELYYRNAADWLTTTLQSN